MTILFVCKYGVETGMGHLSRSKTLAVAINRLYPMFEMDFVAIGKNFAQKLLTDMKFNVVFLERESDFRLHKPYDVVFLDMLDANAVLMEKIRDIRCKVSLSPIFNGFNNIDILFHRTKYLNLNEVYPTLIYAGLEYAIIPDTCHRIPTHRYESALENEYFPIAISMGGGDAANKTLKCLQELKKCEVPATFWVILGEGYSHSYDQLAEEIRNDTKHEIILVRSNKNMWQIMQNCVLCIIPGGVTAYEAVYAGIPFIAIETVKEKQFLLKELLENQLCEIEDSLQNLNFRIKYLFNNRKKLMIMHLNSKNLISGNFAEPVMKKCCEFLEISKK
jgi:spore coat polysaccharide biosynthesis predicted glycosyltransferase SpsG